MKLRAFIQSPTIPDHERIYTLQNKHFYFRAGIDLVQHRQVPTGLQMLFIGSPEISLDALVPKPTDLASAFQTVGQADGVYSLVIGKSDFDIDDAFMALLPPNVAQLAACSINTDDPRATYLPMGCDFRSRVEAEAIRPVAPEDRDILCYANFSVNTHPSRPVLAEVLSQMPEVTCEHMGAFMQYSLTRAEFFDRLSRSKFAICPRGNGIESFRLWDCLYLGVIPVVQREAKFEAELEDLPVLLIDDWGEFLERPVAEWPDLYDDFLEREFNWEKLTLSHWMKRVYDRHFAAFEAMADRLGLSTGAAAHG